MDLLRRISVPTPAGEKHISIYICDIKEIDEPMDIMTVSAFYKSYAPTPSTMLCALNDMGISVRALAHRPQIDLRELCGVWLSQAISNSGLPIKRIGCIEMSPYRADHDAWKDKTTDIITSIQSYFRMLDIASLSGIPVESIGLSVIGSGRQRIDMGLTLIPLFQECVRFLKQNTKSNEIKIIERNPQKAYQVARAMDDSYSLLRESVDSKASNMTMSDRLAFISYSSADKNIADNLCTKLEAAGIKVWYAPRDVSYGDYASSIVDAIVRCTLFIVILSSNSLRSNHVLNEIDLAFSEMAKNKPLRFCPLKIDEEEIGSAFRYYLSRQHWMDAHIPPLERRLDEFVEKLMTETR